jgi:chromodomain-helicase-DNA-binding protein 1
MFKTTDADQTEKLNTLDLDDILNRAEEHETEVNDSGGASLGGEAFLNSFAKVEDIRAEDLSWDDIIPAESRTAIEQEELEAKKAEMSEALASQSRKRAAAQLPGAYAGLDEAVEEMKEADSPAEDKVPQKKKGGPTGPKKTAMQRSLDLKGEMALACALVSCRY